MMGNGGQMLTGMPHVLRGGSHGENGMMNIPQQFLKGGNVEMRKKFEKLCRDAQVCCSLQWRVPHLLFRAQSVQR